MTNYGCEFSGLDLLAMLGLVAMLGCATERPEKTTPGVSPGDAPAIASAPKTAPKATNKVGEFYLPSLQPLNAAQLAALRKLVREDAEAKAIADETARVARPLLTARPHPLEVIHYEGLVHTDPRRVETVKSLREMGDIARLMRYWQVSGDPKAAATLKQFIVAWTSVYKHTGNNVNENKFYPLLIAYLALRGEFDANERQQVDAWVEKLGELHAAAVLNYEHFTNRYVKHVRLAALAGMILDRPKWIETAHVGVKRFVTKSLRRDGSSYDFEHRDTLTYHASALKPAIELAMLAGDAGAELYAWESSKGGSLRKSVNFVVPYAMGEKTHREWVNSKVDLDRRRAAAGLKEYRIGRLYEPKSATSLMELASFFDADLLKVVRHLHEGKATRLPSWQCLVNAAVRKSRQTR